MIQIIETLNTDESPIELHAVNPNSLTFAPQVNVETKTNTHSKSIADGGYTLPDAGSYAIDRDRETEVIVIDTSPARSAIDVNIFGRDGPTVADLNPKYDDAAPIVKVVHTDIADKILEGWESVDELRCAAQNGTLIVRYFPADRLAIKRNRLHSVAGGAK